VLSLFEIGVFSAKILPMSIKLELSPDIEETLRERAQERGFSE
jgi:hypothetical protein